MLESSSWDSPLPGRIPCSSLLPAPRAVSPRSRRAGRDWGGAREPLDQVVPLPSGDFGRGAGGDLGEIDMIHGDVHAVGLAPVLGIAVEPLLVEPGDKMGPHEYLQVLPGGVTAARDDDGRRDPRSECPHTGCLDEIPSGNEPPFPFLHLPPPSGYLDKDG